MRIGINVPNELYDRFKPLRGTYNLSQVCRDAITALIESYEKGRKQASADGMEALANRFFQEYSKKTILDWEAIGRENAKKWAEGASLQDFEDLFHNISIGRRTGGEPGEFLGGWRIAPENRYAVAQQQHEDWFARMFDLDEGTNYYILARAEYNRGWVSYLTAVWQMLREKIEADAAARLTARQQQHTKPEVPKHLEDFFRATGRLPQQTDQDDASERGKPTGKAHQT
ncbi:MAG: hypothetical protein HY675_28750 [Chloroflexi bacterium]|nr:hypothetical protein [Chloroflexota bacterium]